ncbi:MAG: hypothetical protein ACE5OW_08360 [Candidatus Bathyarchaeia archaeon]
MSLGDLSELERKTYEIKEAGGIQPKNLPDRMVGAVTNLKNKGLVRSQQPEN